MAPGVGKYAYVCIQKMIRLALTPAHTGIFWILQLMVKHEPNVLTAGGTELCLFQRSLDDTLVFHNPLFSLVGMGA